MKHSALALALLPALTATAAAQHTTLNATLPVNNPVPRTSNLPFSQQKIRYQQWFEGKQFGTKPNTITGPVRFVGVEFMGSTPAGTTYDIEVTVGNAFTALSGTFDSNYASRKQIVIPRGKIKLTGPTRLMFTKHWNYDGKSNVVVDIKIFGNGTGKNITWNGTSTVLTFSNTKRQYFIGNANAPTANSAGTTGHHGLTTRFLYQVGGAYDFGKGCPGAGNFTPVASVNQVPLPGLATYEQRLSKAGSGLNAVFVIGVSNTKWGTAKLPFNLRFLYAPNCDLLVSPDFYVFTKTVGGGPGTGNAKIATPIPGAGSLGGATLYGQWIVLDPNASNKHLSVSQGLMQVIGK